MRFEICFTAYILFAVFTFGHSYNDKFYDGYEPSRPFQPSKQERAGVVAAMNAIGWPFYWSVVIQEPRK